jgi:hypothetical protein
MAARYEELTCENQIKYKAKAKIAWDMLVGYAPKGILDSYELFGNKIGVGKYQVGSYVLYLIREYCLKNNLPLLNCLIVNANGKIGAKWTHGNNNFEQELIKVKNYSWDKEKNPF